MKAKPHIMHQKKARTSIMKPTRRVSATHLTPVSAVLKLQAQKGTESHITTAYPRLSARAMKPRMGTKLYGLRTIPTVPHAKQSNIVKMRAVWIKDLARIIRKPIVSDVRAAA